MRRYSPLYYSPPRRGYDSRGRSPPRRRYGGHGGSNDQNSRSLLVRNIPLNCRAEDLRGPFERFGPVRDVYLPKDYFSGEPRGFAFIEFVDSYDATEAQYRMNGQRFGGRVITVVVAAETRKRPEEMRYRDRGSGSSRHDSRRSYHGYSRSHSRSPHHQSSRYRERSRSFSPVQRKRDDYSASPQPRRGSEDRRSPIDIPRGRDERKSFSPTHSEDNHHKSHNGYNESPGDRNYSRRSLRHSSPPRSPRRSRRTSLSPSGSRSRSADRFLSRSP